MQSGLSDMDYLRSKVVQTQDTEENDKHDEGDEEEEAQAQHADSAYESSENASLAKTSAEKKLSKVKESATQEVNVETTVQVKIF